MILPLHERLVGRRTLRYARELEWSQWNSPSELRALQGRKLWALLRHAQANSEFYRRRFADAGLPELSASPATTGRADPLALLRTLPLLDKADIRRSLNAMLWHESPGGLHAHNTGGSTGEPLTFYIDRRRQGYDQAARIRAHRWFGVEFGDRELLLWGSPIELGRTDRIKRARDRLFNQRLLDAFHMSEARMDEYMDEWDCFRPRALFGYPSSIARFAAHAAARARRPDTRGLRAVFVTGEVCYPHDRERIASCFGVPVADGYGSREGGFIAHQCARGAMHVTAENVIVEIVRDGHVQPAGESGEIVITHLDAWAMPFIRYRTGDTGRLLGGRCACGRGLPMMDVVHGRATDFLYLPDGNVKHALSIIYPLREMRGIERFRVTQHKDYSVTIDVVCEDSREHISREAVARRVRPVLGSQVAIEVRLAGEIPPTDSGKFRYVISHVVPACSG